MTFVVPGPLSRPFFSSMLEPDRSMAETRGADLVHLITSSCSQLDGFTMVTDRVMLPRVLGWREADPALHLADAVQNLVASGPSGPGTLAISS